MKNQKKKLLVISGATGIGKTALSIALARTLQTEIISADSRQFFTEMNIGVARPAPEELAAVPHHFIAGRSIAEEYSAGRFSEECSEVLQLLFQKYNTVVCVGGSGLYIQALISGLDDLPSDKEIKQKLEAEIQEKGLEQLTVHLKEKDPEYFEEVDLHNPHRVIRALEVIEITGRKFSELRTARTTPPEYEPVIFVLTANREWIYDRINKRVEKMMSEGLLEEAERLYPFRHLNALNTVGYKELFAHFAGDCTLADAVEKIKQHSRNYAKRQETWWRRFEQVHWISVDQYDPLQYIRQNGWLD